jgi:hypothetical protein
VFNPKTTDFTTVYNPTTFRGFTDTLTSAFPVYEQGIYGGHCTPPLRCAACL